MDTATLLEQRAAMRDRLSHRRATIMTFVQREETSLVSNNLFNLALRFGAALLFRKVGGSVWSHAFRVIPLVKSLTNRL